MTTVAAGATGTFTFTATQTVTVTLDPSETARVTITRAGVIVYGCVLTSTRTIGPFLAADVMSITAQRTAIDYTVNSYSLIPNVGAVGFGMGLSADTPTASASNVGYIYVKTDDTYGATPYMSNGVSFVQCGAGAGIGAGLSTTLWVDRGTATLNQVKICTDLGNNGSVLIIGDGTYWQPFGGRQQIYRLAGIVSGSAGATSTPATQSITIPGGLMNIDGRIQLAADFGTGNTVTTSFLPTCTWGTSDTFDGSTSLGTKKIFRFERNIRNNASASAQIVWESQNGDTGSYTTSGGQYQTFSKNSANDQVLAVSATAAGTSITNSIIGLEVWWYR